MVTITKKQARRIYVKLHKVGEAKELEGLEGIKKLFDRVSCLQYDPLDVVGKNADLVLQSRIKNYHKGLLNQLLYEERFLLDGWDKMMAIYPTTYWPHYRRVRLDKDRSIKNTLKYRDSLEALDIVDEVHDYVKEYGPVSSAAMDVGGKKEHTWGHRKMSSATLDYLFHIGVLGVDHKVNTQRVYDTIEKLIPSDLLNAPDPFDTFDDFMDWYVKRRITCLGFMWDKNSSGWLGHYIGKAKLRQKAVERLLEQDEITAFKIEGVNRTFYIASEDQDMLLAELKVKPRARFIAPLDHFMWDRDMVEAIFDFQYRWEVYTPVKKREFGYYVLPILYGNDLVGRIEFDMYRGEPTLKVKNVWFEDKTRVTKKLKVAIDRSLKDFCKYLGADNYTLDNVAKLTIT